MPVTHNIYIVFILISFVDCTKSIYGVGIADSIKNI